MPVTPNRILILSYRHVGDALFTTPALRALRRRFPEAHIAAVVGVQAAPILEDSPHLDELIALPRASIREKWEMRRSLASRNFDTGVLFQHTFLNALFLRWLGCRWRAGLDWKGCEALLTHSTPYVENRHEADRYLAVAAALGAGGDGGGLEMPVRAEARAWAEAFLKPGRTTDGPLVGVFPGSSREWAIKRWPAERFAAAADALACEDRADILLLGGPSDREAVEAVEKTMSARPIVAAGQTTLKELAALLERCALLITNDTGPMHLACAVGTRVIDLVGPGNPAKTGPYGPGHIVIQKVPPSSPKEWKGRRDSPMNLISVEEVAAAARGMLRDCPPLV
ncbi:MAG: glycosyltransferase family 9 protein [Armatimonadetes bacterium]|nr:glycosyltransferase family 9 protein [Armatimonadota bacterium]